MSEHHIQSETFETSDFQIHDLQNMGTDAKVYFETKSGNMYQIFKTLDGRFALADKRSNQGGYLSENDGSKALHVNQPFEYEGGRTNTIKRIIVSRGELNPPREGAAENETRGRVQENSGQKINYEALGKKFKLDEQNPPLPESIFPPMGGNAFGENDTPTLAGRIACRVYDELIERDPKPSREDANQVVEKCVEEQKTFFNYAKARLKERGLAKWEMQDKGGIGLSNKRESGTDQFWYEGATQAHSMYFSKSHAHWKNPQCEEIRAYITVLPEQAKSLSKSFVDLTMKLYEAGIDFTGKCVSPHGGLTRMDDIVLYIAMEDQARAGQLIKEFLDERNIGNGRMRAAVPSPRDGLSWAAEPSKKEHALHHAITGASQASFNSYVAAMAMPTYLDRLAIAHLRKGNQVAANVFVKEAERVRGCMFQ